jgi:hypothetical protein
MRRPKSGSSERVSATQSIRSWKDRLNPRLWDVMTRLDVAGGAGLLYWRRCRRRWRSRFGFRAEDDRVGAHRMSLRRAHILLDEGAMLLKKLQFAAVEPKPAALVAGVDSDECAPVRDGMQGACALGALLRGKLRVARYVKVADDDVEHALQLSAVAPKAFALGTVVQRHARALALGLHQFNSATLGAFHGSLSFWQMLQKWERLSMASFCRSERMQWEV